MNPVEPIGSIPGHGTLVSCKMLRLSRFQRKSRESDRESPDRR